MSIKVFTRQEQRYGQRLLKLRDYLLSIPESQYRHEEIVSELNAKTLCGTVACAFGHAIVSKKFPGLKVKAKVGKYGVNFTYGKLPPLYNDINETKEWANYYFGPRSWQTIFDWEPYDTIARKITPGYFFATDGIRAKINKTIRKAVIKNLKDMAKSFGVTSLTSIK